MKKSRWNVEKSEVLVENPWHTYVHDSGTTASGKPFDYYYVQVDFSVGVIALTEKGLIMVNQYRYPVNRDSLEIPGGGGRKGETPEDTAKKELLEETGYEPKAIIPLGEIDVMNGYSSDQAHIFLATDCKRVAEPSLEETEEGMEVQIHPVEEVFELVQNGKITDSFTLASLLLAWPHIL